MYCIIDYFEGWLLVIMINATVAMEDGHALLFSPFAVTAVHAVIWPVVPLAGKDEETLWKEKQHTTHRCYILHQTVYVNINTMLFKGRFVTGRFACSISQDT